MAFRSDRRGAVPITRLALGAVRQLIGSPRATSPSWPGQLMPTHWAVDMTAVDLLHSFDPSLSNPEESRYLC